MGGWRGDSGGGRTAQAGGEVEDSDLETVAPLAASRLVFWHVPQNNMDPGALDERAVSRGLHLAPGTWSLALPGTAHFVLWLCLLFAQGTFVLSSSFWCQSVLLAGRPGTPGGAGRLFEDRGRGQKVKPGREPEPLAGWPAPRGAQITEVPSHSSRSPCRGEGPGDNVPL